MGKWPSVFFCEGWCYNFCIMFTLKKRFFRVVAVILMGMAFLSSAGHAFAAFQNFITGLNGSWTALSSSGDGNNVVAVNQSSNDYVWFYEKIGGSAFIQRKDAPSTQWSDIAMSRDESLVVAVGLNGGPYSSEDLGNSWNTISTGLPTGVPWRSVAVSGDGSSVALASDEYIFISSDSGSTWATSSASGSGNWFDVAVSDDGSVIAATKDSGSAYLSTDSGASWDAVSEVGLGLWRGASVSADGSTVVVGSSNDYLRYSRDSGSSWSSTSDTGASSLYVSVSADGERMVSFGGLGSPYASFDGGQTWGQKSPFQQWGGVSPFSSDGKTFYAIRSGAIIGFNWGVPTISISSPTNLSVIGEGEWNPLISFGGPDDGSVCEYQLNELPRQVVSCGSTGDELSDEVLTNGDYTLSIFLDENGEATSTSVSFTYNDVTPPDLQLGDFMSPGSSIKSSAWDIGVSWGDSAVCEYAFDEESYQAVDCEAAGYDIPAPSIGQHTLTVRGTDENGNEATVASELFTVTDGYYYWYSAGDTDWFNVDNWYSDESHTVPAGEVPGTHNEMDARLLGPVAPVLDASLIDFSVYYPVDSIDSTGLTGEALERGVSFVNTQQEDSEYAGLQVDRVIGNASFGTGISMGDIEVTGNAYVETLYYGPFSTSTLTINNNTYQPSIGGTLYGPDDQEITLFIFDGHANDEGAVVPTDARFINDAYNYGEVKGDAEFIDSALGYGTLIRGNVSARGDSWVDDSPDGVVIEGNLDVYTPVELPFRATVGGTSTFHGYPDGLYYYVPESWEDDYDWNEPDLWWTGPDLSENAGRIPNSSDDVVLLDSVDSDSGGSTTAVANLFVIDSTLYVDVTVTGLATFQNGAYLDGATITGDALFEEDSYMLGTITGDAEFLSESQAHGIIGGNAIFNDSGNDGTVVGNAEFRGVEAYHEGVVEGNVDVYYPVELPLDGSVYGTITYHGYPDDGFYFNDYDTGDGDWNNQDNWWTDLTLSVNETSIPGINDHVLIVQSTVYGNSGDPASVKSAEFINGYNSIDLTVADGAVFREYAQNQGTIFGDAVFRDNSSNDGIIEGSAEFYDNSSSYGTITGDATFVGDGASFSGGDIDGARIRLIISDTDHEFIFDEQGPWTVIADGAQVDLQDSDYNETTLFIARNGGSFVPEVAPTLSIGSPVASSTLNSWSPSISWGNSESCAYSFDGVSFSDLVCSNGGSDIAAPSAGNVTLTVRGASSTGSSTRTVSFSFSSPSSEGSDNQSSAPPRASSGSSARRASNVASFTTATVVAPSVVPTVSVSIDRSVLARLLSVLLGPSAPASVTVNGLVIPLNLIPSASAAPSPEPESLGTCPDMQVGSTGSCIRLLQRYLNENGFVVSVSGAGSPGLETTTFGPATRSALSRFQSAKGISPAEGYFGARTRVAIGN